MLKRLGEQIGNYRLVRKIGQGGFSEVYLGEHVYLRTQAAIKVLQMRLAYHDLQNFLTEARTIAHLIHPNIVRVMDFGVEHETPFLVMDFAPNGTLRQRYPHYTRLLPTDIVPYVKQIASALQYAHDQRLIHRDIKPENMLVGRNNEILLSDFGIALVAQSSLYQSTQDVVGTVGYMAPEQIQGQPHPASDQYSLGIVVYEWLSGDRPFHGSFTELCAQHMFATPPPLHEKVSTISPAIEQVVQTALAKNPLQRFAHIQDFARAFEAASFPAFPPRQFVSGPPFSTQQSVRPVPSSPQQSNDVPPPWLQQLVRPAPFPSQPPANFPPFPPQQPVGIAPYAPQQPPLTAPFSPPAQYPAPALGTRPASYPAYAEPPAAATRRWHWPFGPAPGVTAPIIRVLSIRVSHIVAMIIGAMLFGLLSHMVVYWHFNTSGSNFLNDGFALPAIVISLFFGALFGPWVGAVTAGLGAFIGDYMFMFFLDHIANHSILSNGIWHGSPLANVFIWIGFTMRSDTDWAWILSNALIGFIAGLAMLGTRGRYVTLARVALAELLAVIGVLAGLELLMISKAWYPGLPYNNFIRFSSTDLLNIGLAHIILPTLALVLTALSFLLPFTNAFTHSRE